jgi:hypothetical protein
MQLLFASFPTVTVSIIFCIWNTYRQYWTRRDSVLRQRVAYMLWVMAHTVP